MIESTQLVVYRLDERQYALPLTVVQRVVRAVDVTPLPRAPGIVIGAIDVAGSVLPVLNIRRRFGLAEREITPMDQYVIAHAGGRAVVLVVDEVQGVIQRPAAEIVGPAQIVPGIERVQGVIQLDDGLVLIYDLEKFLSLDEARALDEAMKQKAMHDS